MHPPHLPAVSPLAHLWSLDPAVCFLNHGSFGATPKAVLAQQQQYRDQMEAEPVRWFVETLEPLLDAARARMASLMNADADDLAFVTNATEGVSTVVTSLRFQPGDELLTSAHEYNACTNALRLSAQRTGAKVVSAPIPFPIASPDEAEHAILSAVTPRTKLVLLSHITSPTGLILPVHRIIAALNARGIDTLLDSAHAPGFLPIDLKTLNPAYCTGNFHKWLCAPKGSAFLFVRKDRQHLIQPLRLSHGYNSPRTDRSRFRLNFDITGTADYSPALCTSTSLDFLSSLLPGGLSEVMHRNNTLLLQGREILSDALRITPPAPTTMLGTLFALILPPHTPAVQSRLDARPTRYADALQDALLKNWRIQVPVFRAAGLDGPSGTPHRILRIAAQLYNTPAQYEYLANAVEHELAAESKL